MKKNVASTLRPSAKRVVLASAASAVLGRVATVVLTFAVDSCGFHLRGAASYPFQSVYVQAPTTFMSFFIDLPTRTWAICSMR